jgi:hypothetical protein
LRFFVDNNLSVHLARGMRAFGEDVDHLQDHFRDDCPDIEWLKHIGENRYFLITRDDAVRRKPAELLALKQFGVGAFFLGGKNRTRWELIQQLIRNWLRIKDYAATERRPFACRIPPSGTKFVRIPLP